MSQDSSTAWKTYGGRGLLIMTVTWGRTDTLVWYASVRRARRVCDVDGVHIVVRGLAKGSSREIGWCHRDVVGTVARRSLHRSRLSWGKAEHGRARHCGSALTA
jgi:hypothetical protein